MPSDGEQIVGTVIESDGNEVPVPVSAVTPLFSDALSDLIYGKGAGDELRVEEREPDGLLRLRVKLFEEDAWKDGLMIGTVNSDGGVLMLTPGPVWCLPNAEGAPQGILIVDSMDRLQPVDDEPLEKRVEPATGDHRPDRIAVYLDDEPLSILSLIVSVAFARGTIAAYEKIRRETQKREPRTHDVQALLTEVNTDPITNAVMSRVGKSAIGPLGYWDEDGTEIYTGNGGHATVTLSTEVDGASMESPFDLYGLNERDRFWYDLATTLFFSGQEEVTGAQILRLCGYKNPYNKSSYLVMNEAVASFFKGMRTLVGINTSEERRNERRKNSEILETIDVTPLFGVRITLEKRAMWHTVKGENGERKEKQEVIYDFTLSLDGKTPNQAFPLSAYARSRSMLARIYRDEYEFKTVKPSLEARQVWYYILRRVHSGISNSVNIESMWANLAFPEPKVAEVKKNGEKRSEKEVARARKDAITKQRGRVLATVEKMLDEFTERGKIAGWRYTVDKKTGVSKSLTILPNSGQEKPVPRSRTRRRTAEKGR